MVLCVLPKGEQPAGIQHTEETIMKTKQELIKKAKKEWGETWSEGTPTSGAIIPMRRSAISFANCLSFMPIEAPPYLVIPLS